MAEYFDDLDRTDELGRLFDRPAGLTRATIEECVNEEGWILGAGSAGAPRCHRGIGMNTGIICSAKVPGPAAAAANPALPGHSRLGGGVR